MTLYFEYREEPVIQVKFHSQGERFGRSGISLSVTHTHTAFGATTLVFVWYHLLG